VLKRIPIRLKLILLAGVPVIGALLLATIIARGARREAQSAAAIGSIEDLAHLSAQMSGLVHALQFERNELSLHMAQKTLEAPELKERFAQTDIARRQLGGFLATRKMSSLPPRLARDLKAAEEKLSALQKERDAAVSGGQPIDELLDYYQATDLSLISATAALSQLADDGQLMRAISALVTVLQIKERASQEHALLSHVFTINEFPAGTYKDLVALTTEEADYVNVLHVDATDSVNEQFKSISQGPEFTRTAELRKVALDTMGDDFHTNPEEWSSAQGKKIERFRSMELVLNEAVEVAALAKVRAAARSVRLSYSLGGSVIALSALLAGLIARGISRSVASLAHAAEQVRNDKDFGIRAAKSSEDELGRLTDTFNEMLSGIEARDDELRSHRENLEQLVQQRTVALQKRNEAMRLVLDNVEQGLATIEPDGTISSERSRAFDEWFDGSEAGDSFADRLARRDERVRGMLMAGWDQVIDGFLPLDCALDQMPQRIEVNGRHYDLSYKAIVEQESLRGALLVVSDVTDELERARRDAEQRELIGIFERVMRDRAGFFEFFEECEELVSEVVGGGIVSLQLAMRAVHTLKGNCGMFGIGSVAEVAHEIESFIVETGALPSAEQAAGLASAWKAFSERVRRLSGAETDAVLEVADEELREIELATQAGVPQAKLAELLGRLRYERGVVRLRRVAEQARSLAQRLGKGELDVRIEASPDLRFQAERWAPFWASFVHVVRNALDHGIEKPEARLRAGKPERAKLSLVAESDGKTLSIEIGDDGRGIDWPRVREKARERGLPHARESDLVDALFSDGLSTAEGVTEVSGRGVGMSAVRDAARALGGIVTVTSRSGIGTTVRFRFPIAEATKASHASFHSRALPNAPPPPAPATTHGSKASVA
jgi:two-component system chemotaxis sensor kinase CheA